MIATPWSHRHHPRTCFLRCHIKRRRFSQSLFAHAHLLSAVFMAMPLPRFQQIQYSLQCKSSNKQGPEALKCFSVDKRGRETRPVKAEAGQCRVVSKQFAGAVATGNRKSHGHFAVVFTNEQLMSGGLLMGRGCRKKRDWNVEYCTVSVEWLSRCICLEHC